MKQANLFVFFGAFLLLLIIPLFVNHEYEEEVRHEHVTVRYAYADGVRYTEVTFCLLDSLQVNFEGVHFESELSNDYFNRYIEN